MNKMSFRYLLFGLFLLFFLSGCSDDVFVSNFNDCVSAGNAVLKSFPEQCVHKGMTFINEEQNLRPGNFNTGCSINDDCVPLPYDCHAHSCISQEYESLLTPNKPFMCTDIFISTAAYSVDDCVCVDNFCMNKNLDEFENHCVYDDDCTLHYYSFYADCCGCYDCCGFSPFQVVSKENLPLLIMKNELECEERDCMPCPDCDECVINFKEISKPYCNKDGLCDSKLDCYSTCEYMNYVLEMSHSDSSAFRSDLTILFRDTERSVCDCDYCDTLCSMCEENGVCELVEELNSDFDIGCVCSY